MVESEKNGAHKPANAKLCRRGQMGRVAGIDFGLARIGLALSDPARTIATPFGIFPRRSPAEEAKFFRQFVEQNGVALFVVGLPLHLSGQESPLSQQAREFGQWLEKATGVPVIFFDERFSTWEADQALASAGLKASFRRRKRDAVAAQKILAAFLESQLSRPDLTLLQRPEASAHSRTGPRSADVDDKAVNSEA